MLRSQCNCWQTAKQQYICFNRAKSPSTNRPNCPLNLAINSMHCEDCTTDCNKSMHQPAEGSSRSRSPASPRSVGMWCAQLGSNWHASGTSSREQVMMRQPASLNRRTVAWPIPRLAPVNISVRDLSVIQRSRPVSHFARRVGTVVWLRMWRVRPPNTICRSLLCE